MDYDAIVLGTGGVGSAALYHLARKGVRALGVDRFPAGHDRGGSHGETRVIRMAYFEHPDYVPLLRRAYVLWDELEQEVGRALFHRVGLLEVGPADGLVVPGVLASDREHQLVVERLSESEMLRRFPGFRLPAGCEAVYEAAAGYLRVEDSVRAHLQAAIARGAEHRTDAEVVGWSAEGDGVRVQTADGSAYRAARLIVTAGPWAEQLLRELGVRFRVLRKHLHWYPAPAAYDEANGCPTFFFEALGGFFYGFPGIDGRGELKIAEHSGGESIADPRDDDRAPDPQDRHRVERFLQACLPDVVRRETRHDVCYYTMSPDDHFLVDRHPQFSQVALAAGLSGHGFKFTSVLGEILADLALKGSTAQPIGFLSATRPSIVGR